MAAVAVVMVVTLLSMSAVVSMVVVPRYCGRRAHPVVVVLGRMASVVAQGPTGVGRRRRFR